MIRFRDIKTGKTTIEPAPPPAGSKKTKATDGARVLERFNAVKAARAQERAIRNKPPARR